MKCAAAPSPRVGARARVTAAVDGSDPSGVLKEPARARKSLPIPRGTTSTSVSALPEPEPEREGIHGAGSFLERGDRQSVVATGRASGGSRVGLGGVLPLDAPACASPSCTSTPLGSSPRRGSGREGRRAAAVARAPPKSGIPSGSGAKPGRGSTKGGIGAPASPSQRQDTSWGLMNCSRGGSGSRISFTGFFALDLGFGFVFGFASVTRPLLHEHDSLSNWEALKLGPLRCILLGGKVSLRLVRPQVRDRHAVVRARRFHLPRERAQVRDSLA